MGSQNPGNSRTAAAISAAGEHLAGSTYAWILLAVLISAQTMSFADRFGWTVAIPTVAPLFKMSMTEAGAMMTAFFGGTVAMQLPGGWLADRFGPRKVLSISLVFLAFFTVATAFVGSTNEMLVLRVLAGASAGTVFSCNMKYQLGWFPSHLRGRAMGFYMMGPNLGTVIATGVLPTVLLSMGWQAIFVIPGLVTLVVAVLIFTLGREIGLARPKAQLQAPPISAATGAAPAQASGTPWYRNRSYIVGCCIGLLNLAISMGFNTWAVTYMTKSVGFSLVLAGAMVATFNLVGMAGAVSAGFAVDFLGSRRKVLWIGYAAAIATFLILGAVAAPSEMLMWVLIVVAGTVMPWCQIPLIAMQNEIVAGPQAATGMGTYNLICQIGSTVAPMLFGAILDLTGQQYGFIWYTVAGLNICGAVLVMFVREKQIVQAKPALAQ